MAKQQEIDLLERELYLKQLQIKSLLYITQSINNSASDESLYKIYKNTLNSDLDIPKLVCFVKDANSKWAIKSQIGFDDYDKFNEHDIGNVAESVLKAHKNRISLLKKDWLKKYKMSFDIIVPVIYLEKSIGFTLIAGLDDKDDIYERIELVSTISSVIFTEIRNRSLLIQKENIEREILKEKQDITLATINLKGYSELQTSILQYWTFFDEYIKKTKGISLNFSAKRFDEGIELNVEVNDKIDKDNLNKYFVEYANILSQNHIDVGNNFDVDVLVSEINHLNKQLELQQQLMMQNLQLTQKLIGERKDFTNISLVPEIVESFKDKVKYYIGKDQIKEAINELYVNSRATDHENEVVLLKSNFNRIKRLERSNLADLNQLNIEYSKIKSSILDLLKEL